MTDEQYSEKLPGAAEFRAARKSERREQKRKRAQEAPVVSRPGVWTGEGYLREGAGLEKLMAERSVKLEGTRREKRRKRKTKSR